MSVDTRSLPSAAHPGDARRRRRAALLGGRVPVLQIAALVLIFAWGAVRIPGFATGSSVRAMLVLSALLGLAALGQTLVVLIGGLDLAVPGYLTVGAVAAVQLGGQASWPVWLVGVVVAAVCALAGLVSGTICHRFGVQSLVVTLGMYSVLVSAVLVWTNGSIIAGPPQVLTDMTSVMARTFGVPVPPVVVIWAVVTLLVGVVLARTPLGRRLYATGTNPRAAAGLQIRTGLVWGATFAIGGAVAGLAGMLLAGFARGATPYTGDPYLFTGIAAVIVGGTALGSARGDYLRTVLGALVLTELTTILAGEGLDEGDTRILYGVAIVAVVAVYGRERRLRDRL